MTLLPFQPSHYLIELFEVAVTDLDGAAGIAVVDGHGKTERVEAIYFLAVRSRRKQNRENNPMQSKVGPA